MYRMDCTLTTHRLIAHCFYSFRRWAAACFVDSQRSIYICGGRKSCDTGDVLNSVEKLKLDENGSPVGKWREVTPMKEKRDGCAAVAVGSRLVICSIEHYREFPDRKFFLES